MAELDKLLAKFEAYALAHKLFSAGDKIIVAFSGGTDSTAMLYLLWKLRGKLNLTLLAVHINHQLRGDEAREDEDFAKAFCLKINVPIIVRKLEFNSRKDLENQARIKRFEAFRQIQKMYRFDTLALAHQKNDQAETILMNLFRGTGINGMGGIRPKSSQGIHPMLCFNADEVSRILVLAELEARLDSSNQLLVHNRNRIRQEFIPMIKKHFNPAFIEKISTQAEIFQKTEEFLRAKSLLSLKKISLEHLPVGEVISIPLLLKLSGIEQFYCLRALFNSISGSENDFFVSSFEEIIRFCQSSGSTSKVISHNVLLKKQYEELSLMMADQEPKDEAPEPIQIDEDRSRAVYMNYRFAFKFLKILPRDADEMHRSHSIIIDADKIRFPFYIRSRRPGDRFVPLGMQHKRKLKEFFIDEKVPVFERDKVPILDDGEKIFWVVPYRVSDEAKRTEGSIRFLQITAEQIDSGRKRQASRINKSVEDE